MDIFTSFKISSSGLQAQQIRLNTISSNLANIETTRTPGGGPYQKKSVVFQPMNDHSFEQTLARNMRGVVKGVEVSEIIADKSPPQKKYDPSHPDAGPDGFVLLPNINYFEEVADLTSASRAYEANLTTIKSAKRMAMKALEIGK